MIAVERLSFKYAGGERMALTDICLEVRDGEFVGIIGRSGSGKSTLSYALNGIAPHYHRGDFYGSVTIDGMDTLSVKPEQLARLVGSVLQDADAQIITSTVSDEVAYGLESQGVRGGELERRVKEALDTVGIGELYARDIGTLSGGQKQKVCIAAILALNPRILILDEPTGELDPQSSRHIFETLKALNQGGVTVIVIEQKIMQLCEFCERLIVLDDGAVCFDGAVRDVLQNAEALEEIGVHIPRVVSLHGRLQAEGVCRCPAPLSIAEAEGMVREALQ